ncbi:MAG TPA: transporter substrate-binding domain-containing protein [Vicinamibacteria bacterium]|nr:transporter substrate-binding domain-containing protein [Vicinamibacteria bacterium]
MKKRWTGVVLAIALCVLALPGGVAAAEAPVLKRVLETGELRVGLSGSQPPMNAKSRTGEIIGLEPELATMLAGAFGVEPKFVEKPFPELLDALNRGEVDIVMSSMAITAERSVDVSFVGPYMISGKSLLTNSRAMASANAVGDVNRADVKLAALANSTSERFIKLNAPQSTFVPVQDYDAGVQMVLKDEVDALVADMPICLLSMLRFPNQGLATLERPLNVEPIGIALSPDDPQFKELLGNYLTAFEGTGIMDRLRKKWLEDGSWIAALP